MLVSLGLWLVLGCRQGREEDISRTEMPPAAEELAITEPFFGDLDEMAERRTIRALVTYSKTHYFFDGPTQRGLAYEALKAFEKELNRKFETRALEIHVVFIPVARDQLLPALAEGRADLAAANLTVTPEREEIVDFSTPIVDGVEEIVVTGPAGPELETLEDLSGEEVWVRPSSSYRESLEALNAELELADLPPVAVRAADERLESEDLLEMVDAGLVGITVVDRHIGEFWDQVFDRIELHDEIVLRQGGEIAWALRPSTPELRAAVDAFLANHRLGTFFGNVMAKRYLQHNRWVRNPVAEGELAKFEEKAELFRKYSERYDFNWLMVAAQAYQESRLDQGAISPAGAVGVMQLLPTTAAAPPIEIPNVWELEGNIHAGIKYLRHIVDTYFDEPGIDPPNRMLFAFASYNAGPTRIARLRREAAEAGLDPDRWFYNVERLAAQEIGRETVRYVSNILKYYLAYRTVHEELAEEAKAQPAALAG